MSERQAFKHFLGGEAADLLGQRIQAVYPPFDAAGYAREVAAAVNDLELKARVAVMAAGLHRHLPPDYPAALAILLDSLGPPMEVGEGMFTHGWYLMPVARFVEAYGLDHFDLSMAALCEITQRHTSEFALRPYLVRYPEATLARLHEWTRHPSSHVRRLVSEGTRPRLPWAARLDAFVRDPRPVLALLEQLRADPSVYVQKSVANNLNDIAKDHPDLILATTSRWMAHKPAEPTVWIVRHGLRTLVKAGDPRALALLGATGGEHIVLADLTMAPLAVPIGAMATFAFQITNSDQCAHAVTVDYRVHFARSNGRSNIKVFKLARVTLKPGETRSLSRSHSFRLARVRRYYPGLHRLEIQVNGRICAGVDFELVSAS